MISVGPYLYFWRVKRLRRALIEILHLRQAANAPQAIETYGS